MTWKETMLFLKDKDCRVSQEIDGLVIECDGKSFLIHVSDEYDLQTTEITDDCIDVDLELELQQKHTSNVFGVE